MSGAPVWVETLNVARAGTDLGESGLTAGDGSRLRLVAILNDPYMVRSAIHESQVHPRVTP